MIEEKKYGEYWIEVYCCYWEGEIYCWGCWRRLWWVSGGRSNEIKVYGGNYNEEKKE